MGKNNHFLFLVALLYVYFYSRYTWPHENFTFHFLPRDLIAHNFTRELIFWAFWLIILSSTLLAGATHPPENPQKPDFQSWLVKY